MRVCVCPFDRAHMCSPAVVGRDEHLKTPFIAACPHSHNTPQTESKDSTVSLAFSFYIIRVTSRFTVTGIFFLFLTIVCKSWDVLETVPLWKSIRVYCQSSWFNFDPQLTLLLAFVFFLQISLAYLMVCLQLEWGVTAHFLRQRLLSAVLLILELCRPPFHIIENKVYI